MEQFRSFDQLRTNELSVNRNGFFRPSFNLTDGQFSYGKLSYASIWKTVTILETAQQTWTIKRKGIFSRTLIITGQNDEELGMVIPEVWSRKIKLNMNNGFDAEFFNKKLFTRTFSLVNDSYGDILSIKTGLWSFKTPFAITFNLDLLKSIPNLPLMALLGVNLILIKQAQSAATAGAGS
ncbi:hypothetical protein [Mucilaginibacter sp. SP1R1]|uniref:hypothetical protein n=1 Tax=Mucilaginibacter sp. SP1R1 TaxID=2723091 RepID=UPI00160A91C2|nr:hypothetical protein [Mucilaginibacter sp. SP1R1]MBB6150694.1 hypothetical protein [Mucilaginibacter sp. SP1R1]